ncbi:unnamed protein product [Effrenium voratum]|nr:unnamed protein product [Effrenium voratum]
MESGDGHNFAHLTVGGCLFSEVGDLGVLVGDFGPVSGPGDAEAPLRGLRDRGWCLAYDQSTIPASCFFGFLADYMATSRQVQAHSIEALATANIIGEAQLDVPLSDHSAVKAAFPMAPSGSAEAEEMPLLGFGSHFMPEDLTERVSDEDFLKHVDEITQAAIQEALSAGVRLIDSGNRQMNQQSVGRALERASRREWSESKLRGKRAVWKDKGGPPKLPAQTGALAFPLSSSGSKSFSPGLKWSAVRWSIVQ